MDDDRVAEPESEPGLPDEQGEYELEEMETADLDKALREAVEAVEAVEVERSEPVAEEAGAEEQARAAETAEESEFARLQAELADLRDRSVRTLADFDNYRKRVARERGEARRYAGLEIARDVLAVIDNLERALSAEGSAEDLKQGVGMIHRQLEETLRRHGVQRVAAVGELFDPAVHEAVARFEDPKVGEPTVSEELQSGYLLHERLLRPAMVKVAMPLSESPVQAAADPDELEAGDEPATD